METSSSKEPKTVRFSKKKLHKTKNTNSNQNGSSYIPLEAEEHINADGDQSEGSLQHLEFKPSTSTENTDTALKQRKIKNKKQRWKSLLNKLFLVMLALVIVLIVLLVWHFSHHTPAIEIKYEGKTMATFNVESRTLTVFNKFDHPVAQLYLDTEDVVAGSIMELRPCASTPNNMCLKWAVKNSSIYITTQEFGDNKDKTKMDCLKVEWKTSKDLPPVDCLNLTYTPNEIWFGTDQYIFNPPQNNNTECVEKCMHYIPGGASVVDPFGDVILNRGGSAVEPLWLSTNGVAVKASTHHSLYVCTKHCEKQSTLCFTSLPYDAHQDLHHADDGFHLDYMICTGESLSFVHREINENFLKPQKYGDIAEPFGDMVNDGVFYENFLKDNVLASNLPLTATNNVLVHLCEDLIKKPLWEVVVYGDILTGINVRSQIAEDLERFGGTVHFSNATQLYKKLGDYHIVNNPAIQTLRKANFKVMMIVLPFVNYDSANFDYGVKKNYLMSVDDDLAPALTTFTIKNTQYYPGVIDLTNNKATLWFLKTLQNFIDESKIDFINMHYGQATWLPEHYKLAEPLHNPGHFSTLYTNTAYLINRCTITDVAYDSQSKNQFLLLSPAKGLRDTLKSALGAGLAGYPFVVPSFPCSLQKASTMMKRGVLLEGMVRWLQMVAFFPIMHLPWDSKTIYKAKVNKSFLFNLTQTYIELRSSSEVYSRLQQAMLEAEINRTNPVISPMWMAFNAINQAKNSKELRQIYEIEDQFMVGKDMFVAPILDMGVTSRDIYVPPGKWKDVVQGTKLETVSGKWMKNYNADLHQIPAFIRV